MPGDDQSPRELEAFHLSRLQRNRRRVLQRYIHRLCIGSRPERGASSNVAVDYRVTKIVPVAFALEIVVMPLDRHRSMQPITS